MNQQYSTSDIVMLAESEQSIFDDVHILTTKGHFLDRIMHLISPELISSGSDDAIYNQAASLINSTTITVSEFVDFTSTPLTVCINADQITDDQVFQAADMVIEAISKQNGARGIVSFGTPTTYSVEEVSHLLNRH